MDFQTIVGWLTTGGGIVALVSVFLSHQAKKEERELNLIDKLSTEIKRLDAKVKELEAELEEKEKEVDEQRDTIIKQSFTITREVERFESLELDNIKLRNIINDLKKSIDTMQKELDLLKKEK